MFHLLVLLSLLAANAYGVTLDATLLAQLGYNNESVDLSLEVHNIDDIDPNAFKGYTKVTAVRLQFNQLSNVDLGVFEDMVNLTSLEFSYNPLTEMTNLKKIVFSHMNTLFLYECPLIASFDSNVTNAFPNLVTFYGNLPSPIKPNQLSPWKKLQTMLVYTKNQTSLTQQHFSGLNSLNDLVFRDSNIKTMEVHSLLAMPNLSSIDLSNNALTSFEYLQIPTKLYQLRLSGNKMNYFMLSRTMGVIEWLFLDKNLFRSFKSMNFTFLANLTQLDLSNNPHAYPNEIAGHMKPLVNLNHVNLINLSINSIDSNFFKQNTNLKTVYLANNKISVLPYNTFSHLKNISTIDLALNQISVLDNRTFAGLDNLTYIYLQFNQLTKIAPKTFFDLSKLGVLELSNNLISEIDSSAFTGCYDLRDIILNYNLLSNISAGTFDNLTIHSLGLGFNQITELNNSTFAGVNSIRSLDLRNNNISRIGPNTFNSFKIKGVLILYSNQLTKIENGTFAGQNQLVEIDLRYNMISTIEAAAFNGLSNLLYIYLDNNNLTQLDSSTFDGCNNLQSIYLKNNPNLVTSNLQSLCPTAAVNCRVYY